MNLAYDDDIYTDEKNVFVANLDDKDLKEGEDDYYDPNYKDVYSDDYYDKDNSSLKDNNRGRFWGSTLWNTGGWMYTPYGLSSSYNNNYWNYNNVGWGSYYYQSWGQPGGYGYNPAYPNCVGCYGSSYYGYNGYGGNPYYNPYNPYYNPYYTSTGYGYNPYYGTYNPYNPYYSGNNNGGGTYDSPGVNSGSTHRGGVGGSNSRYGSTFTQNQNPTVVATTTGGSSGKDYSYVVPSQLTQGGTTFEVAEPTEVKIANNGVFNNSLSSIQRDKERLDSDGYMERNYTTAVTSPSSTSSASRSNSSAWRTSSPQSSSSSAHNNSYSASPTRTSSSATYSRGSSSTYSRSSSPSRSTYNRGGSYYPSTYSRPTSTPSTPSRPTGTTYRANGRR